MIDLIWLDMIDKFKQIEGIGEIYIGRKSKKKRKREK